jgi:hypothetical protein
METLTHWPYTVNPIAAIIAPFFLGLVADRYFATEKVLGVLHLLGGAVLLLVPQASGAPTLFITLLLLYNLCYMPTLGWPTRWRSTTSGPGEAVPADPRVRHHRLDRGGAVHQLRAGRFVVAACRSRRRCRSTRGRRQHAARLYSFTLPHTPPSAAGQASRCAASSGSTH